MRDLDPWLDPTEYVFVRAEAWDDRAIAACREDEGLTLVLPRSVCPEGDFPCRRITLRTVTSLEETGVMAWASTRLSEAGIPCNPVAGFFHDHLFVPIEYAERALKILRGGDAGTLFPCPFCELAQGRDATITGRDEIVMETVNALAFVGSHGFGRHPGHLIVIPRMHVATFMEADSATLAATFELASAAGRLLQAALGCPGITLRQNNGRAGDQEIDHLHVHVFPRWPEDGLYSEPRRLLAEEARREIAAKLMENRPMETIVLETAPGARLFRWTNQEFLSLIDFGILPEGPGHELIDGQIYERGTQKRRHRLGTRLVVSALRAALGDGYDVSTHISLPLGEGEFPEPDVVALKGDATEYRSREETAADVALLVEVVDTRHDLATGAKLGQYARAGIQEYWILDVEARTLEVYRNPRPSGDWGERLWFDEFGEAATLDRPEKAIQVADLLPDV